MLCRRCDGVGHVARMVTSLVACGRVLASTVSYEYRNIISIKGTFRVTYIGTYKSHRQAPVRILCRRTMQVNIMILVKVTGI